MADHTACTAVFSNFAKYIPQMHGLINEHISQSFLYSIMVRKKLLNISLIFQTVYCPLV